jgi:glucose-6-phosphate 1-dehydrogenase
VPGFESKIEPRSLGFKYADSINTIPDAYERVLYDCMVGDQTLFPSTKEIMSQWKIIEALQKQFSKLPLITYKEGSNPDKFKS